MYNEKDKVLLSMSQQFYTLMRQQRVRSIQDQLSNFVFHLDIEKKKFSFSINYELQESASKKSDDIQMNNDFSLKQIYSQLIDIYKLLYRYLALDHKYDKFEQDQLQKIIYLKLINSSFRSSSRGIAQAQDQMQIEQTEDGSIAHGIVKSITITNKVEIQYVDNSTISFEDFIPQYALNKLQLQ